MDVLVPIDGSDCSFRALDFATEFVTRYEASLHVVHFTDAETDATEVIMERAAEMLSDADVDDTPELAKVDLDVRTGNAVGKRVLDLVQTRGYDHVVMGHRGSGTVERAILGSAAETLIRGELVPVTVVP